MAKRFSEQEKSQITQNLIAACKACWKRYGYAKTGIRDIAQLANISVGAFYQFFPSKEMLFVTTADELQLELDQIMHDNMRAYPGKRGVAEGLKALAAAISAMPWLTSMWEEWPTIAQRLPQGHMEQDFRRDMMRMEALIAQYALVPKHSLVCVTQIVDTLLSSMLQLDFTADGITESASFIIDAAIDNLFA